jgi:hypothetical protein
VSDPADVHSPLGGRGSCPRRRHLILRSVRTDEAWEVAVDADVDAESDESCDGARAIVAGMASAVELAKFAYHGDELFPEETRGMAPPGVGISIATAAAPCSCS